MRSQDFLAVHRDTRPNLCTFAEDVEKDTTLTESPNAHTPSIPIIVHHSLNYNLSMYALSHGQPITSIHFTVVYRVAGYFNGVLIFIIVMVNPAVTTFSTHKNFHPLKFPPTLQCCLHMLKFGPATFRRGSFLLLAPHWQCPWSTGSLLKLSHMWWLRKWTEKWKRQKHNQKMGPVPLTHHGSEG